MADIALPSLLDIVFPQLRIILDIADSNAREIVRGYQLCKWYGQFGIFLYLFGNRTTWRIQAQVLGELSDDDALAFKSSVYNECTMIAVAAAIVAQIAITGLSLNYLSQTHWVARACFVLSMTFALMAVYYSTTQQRTLGRLLKGKDVRVWIRGGNRRSVTGRIVPSLDDIFTRLLGGNSQDQSRQAYEQVRLRASVQNSFLSGLFQALYVVSGISHPFDFTTSDPNEYAPDPSNTRDIRGDIINHCFTPSVVSVVTISAPQMLLSSSLAMLLIALAIYFGFVWTRNLDTNSGFHDSRNVFITYAVGLAVAAGVYSVSQLYQNDDKRYERQIVEGYLDEYLANHPDAVTRWGLDSPQFGNGIPLADMGGGAREHDTEAQSPWGLFAES